jgi:hypothetical protein
MMAYAAAVAVGTKTPRTRRISHLVGKIFVFLFSPELLGSATCCCNHYLSRFRFWPDFAEAEG